MDKEERCIKAFRVLMDAGLNVKTIKAHSAPGSTSETCCIALALGSQAYDMLPDPYTNPAAAWHRLDARQRRIVTLYNGDLAAEMA